MPAPCCVPGCNTNYRTGPRFKTYSFPSDPDYRRKWTIAIKRKDFIPSKHSKVCERHFVEADFETSLKAFDEKSGKCIESELLRRRLVPGALLTQFPNLPSYISTAMNHRECPDVKRRKREEQQVSDLIERSLYEFERVKESKEFTTFDKMIKSLDFIDINYWTLVNKSNNLIICRIDMPLPKIKGCLVINDKLEVSAFYGDVKLDKLGEYNLPQNVSNFDVLNNMLEKLKKVICGTGTHDIIDGVLTVIRNLHSLENININMLNFIEEQISLLKINNNSKRYSPELMIFATLFFTLSPCAYKFVRESNNLILPHPSTIRRVCASYNVNPHIEQQDANFLSYIKYKASNLNDYDKTLILMLDEIHLKPFADYKGGSIIGSSYNYLNIASSAHVFMVSSVQSQYRDVVHIFPVKNINAEVLNVYIRSVITGLEKIGLHVLCVISDNNSINRKAVSLFRQPSVLEFVYPHPTNHTIPLFFMIDTVHIFKSIRNNWFGQKNYDKCLFYPKFNFFDDDNMIFEKNFITASWATLSKLHDSEIDCFAKYAYSLSFKSLSPNNFEKQNVKYVIQVFNEFTIQALLDRGLKLELPHHKGTAYFIKIILTWWHIVNVKYPYKGHRMNNDYQTPLTCLLTDKKVTFLNKFLQWLGEWEAMDCTTGKLSKETHNALKISTHTLLDIASYCNDEMNLNYILPGKFQTDDLESRFGMYRQLAGSHYNISLRQLFECEAKLRIQSLLLLKLKSEMFGEIAIDDFEVCDSEEVQNDDAVPLNFNISILSEDIEKEKEYLPVLTYLSGYCAFKIVKKLKCNSCKNNLLLEKQLCISDNFKLIKNLDRGKLSYPADRVIIAILFNYITIKKLCENHEADFLKSGNQKKIATVLTLDLLDIQELFAEQECCDEGHYNEKVFEMLICSASNIFLNNYCKKLNDNLSKTVAAKKEIKSNKNRKLQTLS